MQVNLRKATTQEVHVLVELYERAYLGGYSACFDKYGPVTPKDFWWVQSEKEVYLLEVNRRPVGLVIIGRHEGQLIVEELLGEVDSTRSPLGARSSEEALINRVHSFVAQRFREERQDLLLLRTIESNPLALALVQRHSFTFSNALLVMGRSLIGKASVELPEGYAVRQADLNDAPHIARMSQECLEEPLHPEDVRKFLNRPSCRGFLAVHTGPPVSPGRSEGYPVGFLLAQVREGSVGDWVIGVRELHRRKGVGRALWNHALNFFARRHVSHVITTFWALNAPAERFSRRLGFAPERVYLYFEKRL